MKRELAVALFERDHLTLAQASRIAEVDQLEFQAGLAESGISVHYGVEEYREDFDTLHRLGQI